MRDIESLIPGERVGVWGGHTRIGWGEYRGHVDGRAVVVMDDGAEFSVDLTSRWFSVMDRDGREVSVRSDDPVLVGEPPELE